MNPSKKDRWLNELHSLGIHPKKINALNDIQEQQTLYQDYKTCYSEDNDIREICRGSST